ncbi:DUF11 domain-containing protein [Alteraurantiacibacter aquimixticola]|uniref:DUF11 domain-containing protein n=2 Tax=Alteraurantiacibacter aquimixticola TaxID=2489173 RepID=A0A4T3F447_9SPHN|nr:DUF11 domain-containing protein [Alteraurantiacibacter aquimixticola]
MLGAVSAVALTALSVSPSYAAGTEAGTSITNTVTVNYQVGGIAQTAETASDTFVVDRKIDLLVDQSDAVTTTVSPGETQTVTTFTVTNLSNDVMDVALTAAQLVGGTAEQGGTDNFDVTNLQIWVDNGDGIFDPATDTQVSYIDELAADTTATVFVIGDIPISQETGDVAGVVLTGTAAEGGTAGSQGATIVETTGGDTAGEDTVFADAAGETDVQYDGTHSAGDDWSVLAALVSVTKESLVLSDPVNGTTDPKAIPGATVQYCIKVSNAAGGADATNVTLTDPVPGDVTYVTSTAFVDGTVNGDGTCNAGTTTGSYDGGTTTVSGTIPTLSAGDTRTLVFNATIN